MTLLIDHWTLPILNFSGINEEDVPTLHPALRAQDSTYVLAQLHDWRTKLVAPNDSTKIAQFFDAVPPNGSYPSMSCMLQRNQHEHQSEQEAKVCSDRFLSLYLGSVQCREVSARFLDQWKNGGMNDLGHSSIVTRLRSSRWKINLLPVLSIIEGLNQEAHVAVAKERDVHWQPLTGDGQATGVGVSEVRIKWVPPNHIGYAVLIESKVDVDDKIMSVVWKGKTFQFQQSW